MPGTWLVAIYVLGVVVGLLRVDGAVATKLGVALVWPLGLLAFVVTISALLVVAAMAFPSFGVLLIAALVTAWFLL